MNTIFVQLNQDWNAEPNVPRPRIAIDHSEFLVLSFRMNHFQFSNFSENDMGVLRFKNCWRFRLGDVNQEAFAFGQCRFSRLAPQWGEFYEVSGELLIDRDPKGWWSTDCTPVTKSRHFLFYFRDNAFECDAEEWNFSVRSRESRG